MWANKKVSGEKVRQTLKEIGESTDRWLKINIQKLNSVLKNKDLLEVMDSDIKDMDDCIKKWYRDNDCDSMWKYINEKGNKLKSHIREIFGVKWIFWQFVENLAEWNPENIWVSDTWFLYENRWWYEYGNIEEDESYKKIYNEWIEIFQKNRNKLQSLLPEDTVLVDFWCCEWDKAEALLDETWKKITYLPVDVDSTYIDKAKWKIKKLWIETREWIVNNWKKITDPISEILNDKTTNYTYFFTWWSIWNYSDETINKLLWTTFKPKNWNIILDYYKAPKKIGEIRDLLKCYDNEATKNWFKNWLNNLWYYPWYYIPGKDDIWELPDELKWQYTISKKWFRHIPLNIDEFLEYSVRYEFADEKWNNYYAKLDKNDNIILYSNGWKSIYGISLNNDWDRWEMYRHNWDNRERVKKEEFKEFLQHFNWFQWKIIEWFTAKESANLIKPVEDYVLRIKWESKENEESIQQWETEKWETNDDFHWFNLLMEMFRNYGNNEVYLQNTFCQIWFKWKNGEFIPANFKKWEFYPVEISRRFFEDEIKALLEWAGWHVEKIFDTLGQNWQNTQKSKFLNVIVASTNP